jgi:hypothetical protein
MKQSIHHLPIVTNARQGRALSTRNRPRKSLPPGLAVVLALVAFWTVAALVVTLAR